MKRSSLSRRLWFVTQPLSVAAAALLLAVFAGAPTVGGQESALVVDCDGGTAPVNAECQVGPGQEFTVTIHAASVPAFGYAAVQAKLRWDGSVVNYLPSADIDEEVVWPDCGFPARRDNRPEDTSVLLGCAFSPPDPSTYTGSLVELAFVCVGSGTSELELVPRQGDGQQGSHFIELPPDGVQTIVEPTLMGATVTCDQESAPRSTSSNPSSTPRDQTPTLGSTPTAVQPTMLPPSGTAGEAVEDGGLTSTSWAAVALAVLAAVAVLGAVAWRRLARQ